MLSNKLAVHSSIVVLSHICQFENFVLISVRWFLIFQEKQAFGLNSFLLRLQFPVLPIWACAPSTHASIPRIIAITITT